MSISRTDSINKFCLVKWRQGNLAGYLGVVSQQTVELQPELGPGFCRVSWPPDNSVLAVLIYSLDDGQALLDMATTFNQSLKGQIAIPNTEAPGPARGPPNNIPSSAHTAGNHLFSKTLQSSDIQSVTSLQKPSDPALRPMPPLYPYTAKKPRKELQQLDGSFDKQEVSRNPIINNKHQFRHGSSEKQKITRNPRINNTQQLRHGSSENQKSHNPSKKNTQQFQNGSSEAQKSHNPAKKNRQQFRHGSSENQKSHNPSKNNTQQFRHGSSENQKSHNPSKNNTQQFRHGSSANQKSHNPSKNNTQQFRHGSHPVKPETKSTSKSGSMSTHYSTLAQLSNPKAYASGRVIVNPVSMPTPAQPSYLKSSNPCNLAPVIYNSVYPILTPVTYTPSLRPTSIIVTSIPPPPSASVTSVQNSTPASATITSNLSSSTIDTIRFNSVQSSSSVTPTLSTSSFTSTSLPVTSSTSTLSSNIASPVESNLSQTVKLTKQDIQREFTKVFYECSMIDEKLKNKCKEFLKGIQLNNVKFRDAMEPTFDYCIAKSDFTQEAQ